MKELTDAQFKKSVNALYSSWAEEYCARFKKQRPEARLCLCKIRLNDQLEFIRMYLGFLIIDGKTRSNLNRIKKFLSMQKINSNAFYQIHFVGGTPRELIVHVDNMKEIDISDTHSLVGFNTILIVRRDKPWTRKSRNDMFKAIQYDLEFDGDTFDPASVYINNGSDGYELVFEACGIV